MKTIFGELSIGDCIEYKYWDKLPNYPGIRLIEKSNGYRDKLLTRKGYISEFQGNDIHIRECFSYNCNGYSTNVDKIDTLTIIHKYSKIENGDRIFNPFLDIKIGDFIVTKKEVLEKFNIK